jgi:hypothetical protein
MEASSTATDTATTDKVQIGKKTMECILVMILLCSGSKLAIENTSYSQDTNTYITEHVLCALFVPCTTGCVKR